MHTRMRLGELLLASGLLSADQLEAALQGQRSSGMKLGEYLIKQGICRESDVVDAVCRQTGIERYTPSRFPLNLSLSDRLPADVAQRTNAVPLLIRGDVLVVAMMDPLDIDALDRIEIVTDREVEPVMCLRQEFTQLYAALYGHFNTMDGVMESFTALPDQPMASDDLLIASETPKDELGQPDEAPVVRLVNSILTQAVRESASDIHLSPEKDSIQIRFRIDGVLHEYLSLPLSDYPAIASRIKLIGALNIAESRLPQDGRTNVQLGRTELDMRISTIPILTGESIVLRLLNQDAITFDLKTLGMSPEHLAQFRRLISIPHGMILVVGPTGSGKTTTLYSVISQLNDNRKKIITVEDPVEYKMPGLCQMQVNAKIGVTFANGLRSIVRQDPDIILVGEIRDRETADIAINAALTGHLVLSTLHTNDAVGAVTRLLDMGVENFLVSSALYGVLSQRLVRKICTACHGGGTDAQGVKCRRCNGSGFKGRSGIFELLFLDDDLRMAVNRNASSSELEEIAVKHGMVTLQQDGAAKVAAGITTAEELNRSTAEL